MAASQAGLLNRFSQEPGAEIISPAWEISAYETLWTRFTTVKRMADLFRKHGHALPSVVADREGMTRQEIERTHGDLRQILAFSEYSALFYRDFEYPERLRDARNPVEVLYYQGALDLLSSRCVSVVGTRRASEVGLRRAQKVARLLVQNDFVVMSGLAEGVDTAVHRAVIAVGGKTIAVIGTPLGRYYPQSNRELQDEIARKHLLVSQVPFYMASQRDWRETRVFFPERNKTMSALSEATIIVEASDSSGTLFQAQAAIHQGRKLFVLTSCFESGAEWPAKFLKKGAIRVRDVDDILAKLDPVAR